MEWLVFLASESELWMAQWPAGKSAKWIFTRKVMFCIYCIQCSQILLTCKRMTWLIIIAVAMSLDCRRMYNYSMHLKKVICTFLYFFEVFLYVSTMLSIIMREKFQILMLIKIMKWKFLNRDVWYDTKYCFLDTVKSFPVVKIFIREIFIIYFFYTSHFVTVVSINLITIH